MKGLNRLQGKAIGRVKRVWNVVKDVELTDENEKGLVEAFAQAESAMGVLLEWAVLFWW